MAREFVAHALVRAASRLLATLGVGAMPAPILVDRGSPGAGMSAGAARRSACATRSGQATVEFAVLYAGIVLPLTFAIIFTAELLWIWHSAVDFTREGARYAATHCWQGGGENVKQFMTTHVPRMIDMDQFQSGSAEIAVDYFSKDPDTGQLAEFECTGECSIDCVPDTVTVRIMNYEFRRFVGFLGLPPVPMPDFRTSLPIESAGCDPEQGTCLP